MKRILLTVAVLVGVILAVASIARGHDSIRKWCESRVHVGDYLANLNMPGSPHLLSVKNGIWWYDDNVKITFLEGQVYDKQCGS